MLEAEPSGIRHTFARNLRHAREAKGLSQRELARLAGVSQKYIWQIEVDAANVTLDRVTEMARHLGMTELEAVMDWSASKPQVPAYDRYPEALPL